MEYNQRNYFLCKMCRNTKSEQRIPRAKKFDNAFLARSVGSVDNTFCVRYQNAFFQLRNICTGIKSYLDAERTLNLELAQIRNLIFESTQKIHFKYNYAPGTISVISPPNEFRSTKNPISNNCKSWNAEQSDPTDLGEGRKNCNFPPGAPRATFI